MVLFCFNKPFQPHFPFICDESGSIIKCLQDRGYSHQSCEFHYQQNVQKVSKTIANSEHRSIFLTLSYQFLNAATSTIYDNVVSGFQELTTVYPRVASHFSFFNSFPARIVRYLKSDIPSTSSAEPSNFKSQSTGNIRKGVYESILRDMTESVDNRCYIVVVLLCPSVTLCDSPSCSCSF